MKHCIHCFVGVATYLAPAILLHQAQGWVGTSFPKVIQRRRQSPSRWIILASSFDDSDVSPEEASSDSNNHKNNKNASDDDDDDDDDTKLFASLRARQISLEVQRREQLAAWFKPPTQSKAIPLPNNINDWIRRVAMDQYPYAIVGGASGSLYHVDLERGNLLSSLPNVHASRLNDDETKEEAILALYGNYDGGGIIAIAINDNNLIASSGREGGVQISRIIDPSSSGGGGELESLGRIPKLDSIIATSLAFDHTGILWVGSFDDGMIRGYDIDESKQGSLLYEFQADSGILSLSLADEIGCGVAATVKHGILLFSLQNGTIVGKWDPFSDTKDEFARTALLVQNDEDSPPIWSVAVGGSLGNIHQRELMINQEGTVCKKRPFSDLTPSHKVPNSIKHSGPVVCLVSPGPKILLSGAQDGTIRVWDCSYRQKCDYELATEDDRFDEMGNTKPWAIYALTGYKVWLGSIVVLQGNIMVSDGADNCIVVQHFRKKDKE